MAIIDLFDGHLAAWLFSHSDLGCSESTAAPSHLSMVRAITPVTLTAGNVSNVPAVYEETGSNAMSPADDNR